ALQSAFDLIEDNPDYLKTFIHFGIENGNDNEIEYSIVVLQAIALQKPSKLVQSKKELINLLKKEHFNILETSKELLHLINKSNNSFLTTKELTKTKTLNSANKLFVFLSNLPDWCSKGIFKAYNFIYRQEKIN